jgi:hypothetical protein
VDACIYVGEWPLGWDTRISGAPYIIVLIKYIHKCSDHVSFPKHYMC